MATENFKTLREVAIAIDGVKSVIEGIKSQLALMTLVFAGFAAASVAAFGYFFVISVSNATAIARLEAGQEAHTIRFDGIDKRFDGIDKRFDGIDKRFDGIETDTKRIDGIENRLDGIEKRLDQIVGIIQPPNQKGQREGRAATSTAESPRQ
jgi:tetrahydromethanopterin S-methyltransferase subunit G